MQIEYTLSEINGIGHSTEEKLRNAGITSVSQLASMSSEKLSKIKGFGLLTSQKLITSAKNFLDVNEKVNNNSESNNTFLDDELLISNELHQEDEMNLDSSKSLYNYDNPQNEIKLEKSISENKNLEENYKEEIYNFEIPQNEKISYAKSVKEVFEREKNNEEIIKNSTKFDNMGTTKKLNNINYGYRAVEENMRNPLHQTHYFNYEEDIYTVFNGETLKKEEFAELLQNIIKIFKSQAYYIIPNNSTLLRNISQNFELLALKMIKINEFKTIVLFFPIQISRLRGSLVVYEDSIGYRGSDRKNTMNSKFENQIFNTSISKFIEIQYELFKDISVGKGIFDFINKLAKNSLSITKTKKNKPLYIHSGQVQFKIIVDPLLICSSKPLFLEKSILYPYQRIKNLHIISNRMVKDLLNYSEKKYFLIENSDKQNSIIKHKNSLHKIFTEVRIGSIPFLCFGIILLFIILFLDIFVVETFTRIGIASLGIYIAFLCFSYLRFFNIQKELTEEYSIPHFKLKLNLDETDLLIIKEEMGYKIVDQLVYEYFGKMNEYPIMNKIEQAKAEETNLELSDYKEKKELEFVENYKYTDSKNNKDSFRQKIISKYSEFLED